MSSPKDVKLVGVLKQTRDGFVYVDVPDEMIYGLIDAVDAEDIKKPPYWQKSFDKIGAHISVIGKTDSQNKKIQEIGNNIEYSIVGVKQTKPDSWDEMDKVYFISVKSPQLETLRQKYGLPKKHHGHEFHITFAVKPSKQHKLSSLHEEAPEGIGLRGAKNLGRKIAKAMGLALRNTKARNRKPYHKLQKLGTSYQTGPRINTSPVPRKPRHRKFFGISNPHIPY
jgi:hypothetical protein